MKKLSRPAANIFFLLTTNFASTSTIAVVFSVTILGGKSEIILIEIKPMLIQ